MDSGNCRKLEQIGGYRLIRPAMNAFWKPSLPQSEWDLAVGVFERNSSGGGKWQWMRGGTPQQWPVLWGGFKLLVKPTAFGHIGFFAEQHENWEWIKNTIRSFQKPVKTLNLFAYSGVGSMAMAEAGADVCHLDAARGMIEWGKQNQLENEHVPNSIRWIADDVMKFINREIKREVKYNGIALDPPSFGRGPKGEVWKMEDTINELLEACKAVLDIDKPFFVVLSSHTPGFSPISLHRLLEFHFGAGEIDAGEMTIPEGDNGRMLPAGNFARILVK